MPPSPRPHRTDDHHADRFEGVNQPSIGEEVVITGLSGKFPESDNVRAFMENLYEKVDMVTGDDRRWDIDHPEIPNWIGKTNDMDKFDAQFFGVHYKQAWTMDPLGRMMLENAYGAIIDAGVNPRQLRSTKTGVFMGLSSSEAEKTWFYDRAQINGFGLTGCSRSMLANRVSYWLGATGPSYTIDSACSSTIQALEHAYSAMRNGQCDAAVVGGANFCTHPYVSLHYSRLGVLAQDGKTRSFDKNASGYARAEAVTVFYLQKAKDAKRIYAQIVHAKSNCDGFNDKYSYPSMQSHREFFKSFYDEINMSPADVEYIEAFGAGIPDAEKNELEAIDEVFCKNRRQPILVGSVKSNMGHAEAASGGCSITKVCLAYERGELPSNLHYSTPRDDVAGIREGRIRVVAEHTPFNRGYAAVCCNSFTGGNVHVLLKGFSKITNNLYENDLPRLVTASGRSEPRLLNIYEDLQSLPLNMEQIRLLHSIHEAPIPGHVFRSYNILKTRGESTVSLAQSIDYYSGVKRPVWFVYSGMGSQWPGMATDLMQLPIFAAAIKRCCKILAPKGIDLIKILTDLDPTIYDNILHSFVGIAAVQIGLTDVLSALGIQPDNIIGHSVGELGCAYADGCFTAEEMILAAYSRGLVSVQTPFIKGSMAAVGIGFQDVKSLCVPEIEIACHNGPDSCTISGPAEEMKTFVDELVAKGIFAKEVPCSNIAYHSKYIAKAGPALLKYLQEVIKEPKARSSRWLSTSVPQVEWGLPKAKLSSAEYHTNNLLNAVLFEETSRLIPPNAITIEIAPHGLLQAILRRSLPTDCVNIPLTKRGHKDNVEFILNSIGKLYMNGLDPKVANIYPEVQFPVSVGTPMLSHLVSWEHSEEWYSHQFHRTLRAKSGERNFVMATCDEEYRFLSGNIINDLNRFPTSGYLVLVWETLAMMLGTHYTELSVVFENVHIYGDTLIQNDEIFELRIMVQKVTGNFEINWNESIIADGRIYAEKSSKLQQLQLTQASYNSKDETTLSEEDVYNILALKGYSYSGVFRGIKKMDISFNNADVNWANNWIALIDSMIQMKVMKENYEGVSELKAIQKMVINTKIHKKMVQDLLIKCGACLQCGAYEDYDLTRCGGVEIIGMRTSHVPKQIMIAPTALQSYTFVPSINENVVEEHEALNTLVQLVLQNSSQDNINILELVDEGNESMTFAPLLRVILQQLSYETRQDQVKILQKLISPHDVPIARVEEAKNAVLVIASNLSDKKKVIRQLYGSLAANSFLLAREKAVNDEAIFKDKFHIIGVTKTTNERLLLLRKRTMETKNTKYITVKSNSKFSWVELVQFSLQKCEKLVLISECDPMGGLLGFFNSMRREPDGQVLSLVLISDYNAPAFRPDLAFYHDQLAKNMPLNVYQNGKWGTYQYRPLGPSSPVLSERVFLTSQRPQDLSSLTWVEGITSIKNSSVHKKLVQVYYSALTSLDVQKASSRLQEDEDNLIHSNSYGMDFCGRTFTGERVMGLLPTGALSSVVGADVDMLWPVPSHWSMEDAATVPQAYANAFYCLAIQSTLRAGMSVLIHNGADALGQAAISICLAHTCKVFVTVGTQNKKEMLLRIFPGLKECNIGNSKDDSFEAMVMAGTNGNGCDIVLNTLSGNLCRVSMRCVAGNGYFVNLNMEDIAEDKTFGMYFLFLERKYRAASICNIFKLHNFKLKKTIQQMMTEGINKGYVQPLSRVVFNMKHTTRAFRFMSTGRNMGKVVLKIHDEELRPLVTLSHTLFNAQPYYTCSEEGSYLVVTSDDSGLQLADWLVQRGARNLQLHLQQPKNGYQATMIRSWMQKGVNVQRSLEDLQTEIGCMQTLTNASKMGPVLGVFVTNTFIRRGLFINLTPEDFVKEFGDKAAVLMNLDSATRKLCSQLREFVVFSNQATRHCGLGCSASRLADSVAERICEERCKLGLPALALQWGVLEELDTRSIGVREKITKSNYSMNSTLSSLDQLLKSKVPLASSFACSDLEKRKTNILEAVAEVIGVQDFKDLAEDYTLEQLSTEIMAVRELQVMFERDFHLIYTPQRILKMSITELNRLQSKLNEGTKASASGLDLFFTYIDPEEFNAGDPLVRMPTLLSDGTEPEEDLYAKDTYLIMIPGMEGHKNIFPTVTRRLKMNAFACQLPLEKFNESVQDMATRMTTDIMKKVRPASKFYLFAYSFGVSIALEIASNLESQGYTGFVFCLDGGPEYFKALLDSHIGHLNEHQLQNEVIKHMIHLISGSSSQALERSLTTSEDWEQKLNITMCHLRRHVKFSFQYTRSLLAMAYARIQQARAYSNTNLKKLKSEIILLKATRNLLNCRMEDDYGLGKYSELPVRIFELDCDHASAPYDLNCANIVNSLIIDMYEFRKVNLCDTYVVQMSV